jgi:hypothetical protein
MNNASVSISVANLLAKVQDPFRGHGEDVSGCGNRPDAILSKAGLDWKVVQMPVGAIGRRETRVVQGYRANVRSDNGAVVGVVSDTYQPHQNASLIEAMASFADTAGMTVSRAGSFGGGSHVWAVADTTATGEVGVGDIYRLRIAMRSSHDGRSSSTFRSWYERLACLNGMTRDVNTGVIRYLHSAALTRAKVEAVVRFMRDAETGFRSYLSEMNRLRQTPSTPVIDRLIMLEVVAPDLLRQVYERLRRVSNVRPSSSTPTSPESESTSTSTSILEDVIQASSLRDNSITIVREMIQESRSRTAKLLDSIIDNQQGGDLTRGSLAHVVNAVSAYQTHLRGNGETATNALMFTPGNDLAQRTMQVAVQYASRIEAAVAR